MEKDFSNIKKLYSQLVAERSKYVSKWQEIAKYAGIKSTFTETTEIGGVDTDKDKNFDKYTYDPTCALSIQQSADYLKGVMWGNGDNVFTLEPSDEVLAMVDIDAVKDWYEFATASLLKHMNHFEAGLNNALSSYFYDQKSIGTSGVGAYPAKGFKQGLCDNAIVFRPYGVDTMCIDEGKNGNVDIIFNTYKWRVNRIVSEFCGNDEAFDIEAFKKLPEKIQKAYNDRNFDLTFKIIHAVLPNDLYTPDTKGIKGCKYVGFWYCDDDNEGFFYTEHYEEKPIAVGREEKIRGEIYGRSSGTMLLSTIKCVNEAIKSSMVNMDKMNEPPIGILGNALFGDSKVDTSARGLTVFNAKFLAGENPIVKMQDIGDITPLVQFLMPYLNEKIATAFKIDLLLDFSAKANMTATETMQRYAIRGRALAGMINKHKTELFMPLINRCVSLLWQAEQFGVRPDDPRAQIAIQTGMTNRIIPQEVLAIKESGLKWYKVRFNNDIEKLTRTEVFDDLTKELNMIVALLQINPQLSSAFDWHALARKSADALGFADIVVSERTYKEQIEAQAQAQAQAEQLQMANIQSQTNRNNAGAMRDASGQ